MDEWSLPKAGSAPTTKVIRSRTLDQVPQDNPWADTKPSTQPKSKTKPKTGPRRATVTTKPDKTFTVTAGQVPPQHQRTQSDSAGIIPSFQKSPAIRWKSIMGLQGGLKRLTQEIKECDEELKELIVQTQLARRPNEREALRDRGNKQTLELLSLQSLSVDLKQILLASLAQAQRQSGSGRYELDLEKGFGIAKPELPISEQAISELDEEGLVEVSTRALGRLNDRKAKSPVRPKGLIQVLDSEDFDKPRPQSPDRASLDQENSLVGSTIVAQSSEGSDRDESQPRSVRLLHGRSQSTNRVELDLDDKIAHAWARNAHRVELDLDEIAAASGMAAEELVIKTVEKNPEEPRKAEGLSSLWEDATPKGNAEESQDESLTPQDSRTIFDANAKASPQSEPPQEHNTAPEPNLSHVFVSREQSKPRYGGLPPIHEADTSRPIVSRDVSQTPSRRSNTTEASTSNPTDSRSSSQFRQLSNSISSAASTQNALSPITTTESQPQHQPQPARIEPKQKPKSFTNRLSSSSSAGKSPRAYALFRLKKTGKDWGVADVIQVGISQKEIEQKMRIALKKFNDSLTNSASAPASGNDKVEFGAAEQLSGMKPKRRAQVNRLIGEMNQLEDEEDRERGWGWEIVSVEETHVVLTARETRDVRVMEVVLQRGRKMKVVEKAEEAAEEGN